MVALCIALGIALHLQDHRFDREQERLLGRLAQIELEHTTREQALALFSDPKQVRAYDYYCGQNPDCVVFVTSLHTHAPEYPDFLSDFSRMPDLFYDAANNLMGGIAWDILWDVAHTLGLQPQSATVTLRFQDGRVTEWDYERKMARDDFHPRGGVLTLTIHSLRESDLDDRLDRFQGSPIPPHDFLIRNRYTPTGHISREVFFTPHAPPKVRLAIFHVETDCLYAFHGCGSAMQLIPDAEADAALLEASQ